MSESGKPFMASKMDLACWTMATMVLQGVIHEDSFSLAWFMLTIHIHCWRVVQKEHATTNHHREYSDAYSNHVMLVFSLLKKTSICSISLRLQRFNHVDSDHHWSDFMDRKHGCWCWCRCYNLGFYHVASLGWIHLGDPNGFVLDVFGKEKKFFFRFCHGRSPTTHRYHSINPNQSIFGVKQIDCVEYCLWFNHPGFRGMAERVLQLPGGRMQIEFSCTSGKVFKIVQAWSIVTWCQTKPGMCLTWILLENHRAEVPSF